MPSNAQQEAICHDQGPAMIIAGPGSGKTFTLINRIIYLINNRIPPDRILVVTFSKAAALEMENRYNQLTSQCGVRFFTFHSLAYNILQKYYNINSSNLISEKEKTRMLSQILKNHGFENYINTDFLLSLLNAYSRIKNSTDYNNAIIQDISNPYITQNDINMILESYKCFVYENNKYDFDDLIIQSIDLFNKNPACLNSFRNSFDYIMIDEFQDINMPQYNLIKLIINHENNLFVVGDDDQSIYKFRGSFPGIMKKFVNDFPNCHKIYLTENYRSDFKIVNLASTVIEEDKTRLYKKFVATNPGGNVKFNIYQSRLEEEKAILKLIRSMNECEIDKTAIILRTNKEVSIYKNLLEKNNIRVFRQKKTQSNDNFYDIAEDIAAFLKFIYEKPLRTYFIKFMNKPNRFIERASLVKEEVSSSMMLNYYRYNEEMKVVINDLFRLIDLARKMPPYLSVHLFRNTLGYDNYLKKVSQNPIEYKNKLIYLNNLEDYMKTYNPSQSIHDYIQDFVNISNPEKPQNTFQISSDKPSIPENNGIKVMTMHNSKGLEFDTVILPDLNEGIIPPKNCSGDNLDEERRLLYVAMTRAAHNLFLISTNERNRKVTRFLLPVTK